jgi:hypothetical protein
MTFEQWWDTVAKTPAPDTFKNWEESCRQAWAAGVATERKRCKQVMKRWTETVERHEWQTVPPNSPAPSKPITG